MSADGGLIVGGSYDNAIKIWDMQEWRDGCIFIGHASNVASVNCRSRVDRE